VKEGVNRNKIVQFLEEHGVQTRMLFAGNIIKHPCFDEIRDDYSKYKVIGNLENTNRIMNDTFWIGLYPGMTNVKLDYMIKCIKNSLE
ncbi:DegT/DnrJ/EryC1/StrS family aminotransferase, partial [Methanosphaera sp.]|uniref:DegT/DnrJ/EryC1/StrS family aminotransferase n=1 Tax=Methanosphaera sp. TaxID=2666342 RepID=UPI002E797DFA